MGRSFIVAKYQREVLALKMLLAVAGSVMIIIYGIIRHDWALLIGQFAVVFSIRNVMIYFASTRK